VNRVVLLDTGIIGLITNPKRAPESLACNCWLQILIKAGIRVILPEIADYEVRRELLRANKIKGIKGIKRLDELARVTLPLTHPTNNCASVLMTKY
jgi:hypothetical protein